ncbi:hypothetical protein, partial [Duganella callida]|uniref:hypothetical protein n=1 Tax=Duganella callida TaxID=2561932 RepID=UPI001431C71A
MARIVQHARAIIQSKIGMAGHKRHLSTVFTASRALRPAYVPRTDPLLSERKNMLCNLKRLFGATLVLALCAGVAQAGEETAAAKTSAASGQGASAGRGDEARPAAP